ncbi:MAG TPA: Crp/Fnr family transcriptional regulator [Solirubrobacteraceae bacterium]|nr:Crp/Fnr family transcriptional regulator [Solirubrobacteraceae bacterium]
MRVAAPIETPVAPAIRQAVRLLDIEPDFARGVDAEQAAEARRLTVVPLADVPAGPWDPSVLGSTRPTGAFAAFVVTGLVVRECLIGERTTTQLIGPGDVLPITPAEAGVPGGVVVCRAAAETRIAVLDERFLAAARRWPWLMARMMERTARWADRALTQQAISQLPRVDVRIVALLSGLSERWGRVVPDGVLIPLTLTHAAIGTLVGAQRPTVTLAVRELAERGMVTRRADGWLLHSTAEDLLLDLPAGTRSGSSATATLRVVPRTVEERDEPRRRLAEPAR